MHIKKTRYGDSAKADKRSPGGPAEPLGCIGTRFTQIATSLELQVNGQYWTTLRDYLQCLPKQDVTRCDGGCRLSSIKHLDE